MSVDEGDSKEKNKPSGIGRVFQSFLFELDRLAEHKPALSSSLNSVSDDSEKTYRCITRYEVAENDMRLIVMCAKGDQKKDLEEQAKAKEDAYSWSRDIKLAISGVAGVGLAEFVNCFTADVLRSSHGVATGVLVAVGLGLFILKRHLDKKAESVLSKKFDERQPSNTWEAYWDKLKTDSRAHNNIYK